MLAIIHQLGRYLKHRRCVSMGSYRNSFVGSPLQFMKSPQKSGSARGTASTSFLRNNVGSVPPPSSSTMNIDSYEHTSKNQYAAHLLTRDMLSASMERLAKRCDAEDRGTVADGVPARRRRIADLGAADGSSSVETLKFAVRCLNDSRPAGGILLHVTFEDHPASDETKLQSVLNAHGEWFDKNDIARDVLMKSFYEPLFEPNSMDFMMSYICLHWLDGTDVSEGGSLAEWKTLGGEGEKGDFHMDWTHINEPNTPRHIFEAWRTNLAHVHFAKFLSLRSRELRPGAELLIVMVGDPHEFARPSDRGPGPLSRAMKRCVDRGDLRADVLHRTVVPYFMRTASNVEAGLKMAETRFGALLQLVECRAVPAITIGDEDALGGAFDLFWSIHLHAIENANPTRRELQSIKAETREVFDEIYDSDVGIRSTFVACVLRRRTRERWAS